MKIWEKVNNITGNSSKARFLIEYINAGAKFILSASPEKFLWTIASESEVDGFDSTGASQIGTGSSIAYDKVLAVYRYDSGKKRVCAEAPDSNIHIFDEAGSLLRATEMFPKFYKLGGKIYIKPDPDYNAHKGVGNEYQHTYTDLDGNSVAVNSEEGDKGVIVYSAPPVVDENTDSWILAEYENIAVFYAASLDHMRLAATYRDLCKTEIDKIFSTTIITFNNNMPGSFLISTNLPSSFSLNKSIPSFNFVGSLPSGISLTKSLPNGMVMSESLPSDIDISGATLPSFSFTDVLPVGISVSTSLPDGLSVNSSLPSGIVVSTAIPSIFSPSKDLTSVSYDTTQTLPTYSLPVLTTNLTTYNTDVNNAESILEGALASTDGTPKTPKSALYWLEDEDSEMSRATSEVVQTEIGISNARLAGEKHKIDEFSNKVSSITNEFNGNLQKYAQDFAQASSSVRAGVEMQNSDVQREQNRISSEVAKYSAEVQKEGSRFSSDISKYQSELSKEQQRIASQINIFKSELDRESQRYNADLQKYGQSLQKQTSQFQSDLAKYTTLVDKEIKRFNTEVSAYQAELAKESASKGFDVSLYEKELQKEVQRISTEISVFQSDLAKASQKFESDSTAFNLEVQKESARIQSELGKYGAEVSKEGARFQSDLAKAKASLDEAAIRLQSSGAYTQKSQASIQTSQLYYQRALSELQGITGAMTAPEQQQQSQRREQGAST